MKGEVKGQWNGGETGHKSGPGRPVEYLSGAWGPTVLPQLSLNRRSNLVLPRGGMGKEKKRKKEGRRRGGKRKEKKSSEPCLP